MRGQSSVEFVILVGLLLFIASAAAYVSVSNTNAISQESVLSEAKKILELVATEINLAAEIGPGYSHTFVMPTALAGLNYSIAVLNQRAYILWEAKSYSLPIIIYNVTGEVKKGTNTIRNVAGVVEVV